MSFEISKQSLTPAPAGKWQGVCVDVRDEGMQTSQYLDENGNPKPPKRKISIHFQLNAPRDENGALPGVAKWFTYSLHEKSTLAKFLCEWFECAYAAIPPKFDLDTLVGVNARMRIIHEPKKDGTGDRAVIQSIERWESEPMQAEGYTRKVDRPQQAQQSQQAFAPNPNQSLPATNRQPQQPMRPVTPNAAPQTVVPDDFKPQGLKMPDARQQQRDYAKQLAKGGLQPAAATPAGAPQQAPQYTGDEFDDEDVEGPFAGDGGGAMTVAEINAVSPPQQQTLIAPQRSAAPAVPSGSENTAFTR
jgi:hypothetical protein